MTYSQLTLSSDPDLKYAIGTKFKWLHELGAMWQTATASLSSDHIQPWVPLPTPPSLHDVRHSRTQIPISDANRIEDHDGVLAVESSDDDSLNSVDGELDPMVEVDITIGEAIDRDAMQARE
jgi:hypothetical protein